MIQEMPLDTFIQVANRDSEFKIRQAAPDDFPRLCELGENFYAEMKISGKFSSEHFTDSWALLAKTGVGELWVLECDNRVLGSVGFIAVSDINSGEKVASELFWFMDPLARGQGKALLEKFEARAKELGCARMLMIHLAGPRSETLSRLYERRGYKLLESHFVKEIT